MDLCPVCKGDGVLCGMCGEREELCDCGVWEYFDQCDYCEGFGDLDKDDDEGEE
jgi:hypothetical protein